MILKREEELVELTFKDLSKIKELHILAENISDRLGVFSFYVDKIHHNLMTKLLNDRFGIQVRGGCSCAGTYGHYLLNVDLKQSKEITDRIDSGDLSLKPGWIRLSLHPTMSDDELKYIISSIKSTIENVIEWGKEYNYNNHTNEFYHKSFPENNGFDFSQWFTLNK